MEKVQVNLSGALVQGHRQAMEDIVGPALVKQALEALGPPTLDHYGSITAFGWCPVEIVDAVTTEVAKLAEREVLSFHADVTRLNLQRKLTTLWRLLLRMTTDSALISRTPVLYTKSYDRGELVSRVVSPGRSTVTVRGWPGMSLLQIDGLRIAVTTVLEVAGRKEVRVIGRSHPLGADLTANWR